MDVAWNFRREHLPLTQRSHYVITDGGDQPNVVPPTATVWYYFREQDAPKVQALFALGDTIARAAAMMTSTKLVGVDIVGGGWSGHFNKVIAYADEREHQGRRHARPIRKPTSSSRAAFRRSSVKNRADSAAGNGRGGGGAAGELRAPPLPADFRGGGSDDIGDVSWNVPTVTLSFPGNIPGLPGHNWANAISMATPIAHKGATAGAKVQAMTTLDLMTKPTLITQAWDYFKNVQTKEIKYYPADASRRQAAHLDEQDDDGQDASGDAQVLLRSDEVQDVSRAARHQVSDCSRYDADGSVRK